MSNELKDLVGLCMFVVGVVFVVGLFVFIAVSGEIHRRREWKEMTARGYQWKFVISCSADPGSWQWVKPL